MDTPDILNAAFDSCRVRYNDRAAALAELKADGREIHFEGDRAFVHYDGERLELSDALLRFGYDRRDLVDGRTLPREGAGATRPGIDNKTTYPDTASKAKFIREHGIEAWERLPLTGPTSNEVLTKEDWYRLPRAEKVRRLTEAALSPCRIQSP